MNSIKPSEILFFAKIKLSALKPFLIITILILTIGCRSKVIQYPVNYDDDRAKFMSFSQDLNKQILKEETVRIEKFLENNSQKFSQTAYGFWISNTGITTPTMAKSGDFVKYNYQVSDLDNKIIYSEKEIGVRESILGRDDLPRGLHISLQLIEKGDSAISVMPSFLAYGGFGDQNLIDGNEPLVFKVKVLDIKKK